MGWLRGILIGAALVLPAACARHDRLVVYTAAEADQIPAYEAAFRKADPGVDLVWVRDSTGVVTAKLLAEKKAPQADAVFALAATSMMELDEAGLLAPYAPKGEARLDPRFKDGRAVPHWTGEALWSALVCANTRELAARNLPVPASWEDLTKPIYKGMIAMPDPASSGTGLLTVGAWLQMFGEPKAWAYMDRLNVNIAGYDHSGSKPCKDAARGEIPIGISLDFRAGQEKRDGLPIAVVAPSEGLGWELEATGLVKGSRHDKAAKAFVDWAMSDEAMRLYAKNFTVVAAPGLSAAVPGLPPDLPAHLAKVDLGWTARNRDRIIAEWSARYRAKSAPKTVAGRP